VIVYLSQREWFFRPLRANCFLKQIGVGKVIERKAFLQITKALILSLRSGLADSSVCIKQSIIEELAGILGVERCAIFKISREQTDGRWEDFCEIVAGVPLEEYGPDARERTPLEAHPDIHAAAVKGQTLVVQNPLDDERTAYFRGIVEKRCISEIAYIPLFINDDSQVTGVIVIDAVHGMRFSDDDILFCSEVAELLDLLLGQESVMLQHFRDMIINKLVPLGGFACRLQENLQATLKYIDIIQKEAVEISSVLPKKLNVEL
jgi:hypothetical protein